MIEHIDGFPVNDTELLDEIKQFLSSQGIEVIQVDAPITIDKETNEEIKMITMVVDVEWEKVITSYINDNQITKFYIYQAITHEISNAPDRIRIRASWINKC